MKPEELLYSQTHEWAHVTSDGGKRIATIGISAFAVEQLTDLVYMELPEVGRTLSAGEEFGVVESVKAVSPLYSPVAGEVIEVNTGLPDKLESLGTDPYNLGWIMKVRLSDEAALKKLQDYASYQKQCAAES